MIIRTQKILLLLIVLVTFSLARVVFADEFQSADYSVIDPVFLSGSYGTSTSFGLLGSISGLAIGTSTSQDFGLKSGFLFFPLVTSPVVTATSLDGQVSLSWTASTGSLGFTVSGYKIGYSTISGGPYTLSTVGNVTTATVTGLTNSTPYYFVVLSLDSFSSTIATSTEVSATPVGTTPVTPVNSGGGGGALASFQPSLGGVLPGGGGVVVLQGYAYPFAKVSILKDGSAVAEVRADGTGNWIAPVEIIGGTYGFSIITTDQDGQRSVALGISTEVIPGRGTSVSNVISSPTLILKKTSIQSGEMITFAGYTYPFSKVRLTINSTTAIVVEVSSDKVGKWSYTLNSKLLEVGDHMVKVQAILPNGLVSPISDVADFQVAAVPIIKPIKADVDVPARRACSPRGDLNADSRVDLVDLSIMLYSWGRTKIVNTCADLNKDKKVNISDLSIMLYWWTG